MDKYIIAIYSLTLGMLITNFVWMVITDKSFRERHKRIQEQLDRLKKD